MRSSLNAWRRISAAWSLFVHLVLVVVGPAADARLELATAPIGRAPAHVEEAPATADRAGHHHQVCLIRALQSMDSPPEQSRLRAARDLSSGGPSLTPPPVRTETAAISALGPRAPPGA